MIPEWVWSALAAAIIVVPSFTIFVRAVRSESSNEWKELAESRGEANEDLRRENEELRQHYETEMSQVLTRLQRVEDRMEALLDLKAEEIADKVVDKLRGRIET